MSNKEYTYEYNGVIYPVIVTYKRIRNTYYRFRDNCFYISTSRLTLKMTIMNGLKRFGPKLIKQSEKRKDIISPIGEDYVYIFGNKIDTKDGHIILDEKEINFDNNEQLIKEVKKWFLGYLKQRTAQYEKEMNVGQYKVKLKDMKSRYGSNSKQTKTISYSSILLHYSEEIIDSVIVHELAHALVFNHSDKFYQVVLKYCPNYWVYHTKLRKGEFR